ncbi:ABC transporter permease [Nocardioides yefusunii]|uniref:ABC transporter permease n=1 Tax=Nocardioides yefusunii TaxID=2500546 RepID=A0ABW1QZI7_9ACTN|nr:ABC transporter permease [Nocardioides yefusunii]
MTGADPQNPGGAGDGTPEVPPTPEVENPTAGTTLTEDPPADDAERAESRWAGALRDAVSGNAATAFFSVFLAAVIGSLLIIATDSDVHDTLGYVTARPGDFFTAAWDAISGAYSALWQGAVWNSNASDFAGRIKPLTQTLQFAAPLVLAGLGVGLAFRAGMFNIGGRGQMLLGGAAAAWVAIEWDVAALFAPMGSFVAHSMHLLVALLVAVLVGGLWGALAGLLKARTGAHEVIVTIMLNYVALQLISFALHRQGLLQADGSNQPKSAPTPETAQLPQILGDRFTLHAGILLALVAVAVVWWLLNRSALGYRFRAVGENPAAARAAGIDVGKTYILVMFLAGALVGLAGANQSLGTVTSGVNSGLDSGIGFDAITVALLGRSNPVGILFAGLLFGAFKSGGFTMQALEGIPVDLVLVLQSLIVLFLAAPPLVRAIFRLPSKEAK